MASPVPLSAPPEEFQTPYQRFLFALFAGSIVVCWSFGLAIALLVLCLLATLVGTRRRQVAWRQSPLDLAVVLYALGSLVALAASVEPGLSLRSISDLPALLLVPLTMVHVRSWRSAGLVIDGLAFAGALIAAIAIVQVGLSPSPRSDGSTLRSAILLLAVLAVLGRIALGPGSRVRRTVTGSAVVVAALLVVLSVSPVLDRGAALGLRLLLLVLLAAVLLPFRRGKSLAHGDALAVAATLMTAALFLQGGRGVWLGLAVGGLVIVLAATPRALLASIAAAILLVLLLPPSWFDPVRGTFDPREPSNRSRVAMIESGLEMVRDRPLVGLGPGTVRYRYPLYRQADDEPFSVADLHNNVIGLAAERGLPTASAYVAMLAIFLVGVGRRMRRITSRAEKAAVVTPLAAIAGVSGAGLFEMNFTRPEVLLPTLFFLSIPFAVGSTSRGADA